MASTTFVTSAATLLVASFLNVDAVAQDRAAPRISSEVLRARGEVVEESEVPSAPAPLGAAARLRFVEELLARPAPMEARSGVTKLQRHVSSLEAMESSSLASPVLRLSPRTPYVEARGAYLGMGSARPYSPHSGSHGYARTGRTGDLLIVFEPTSDDTELYLVDFAVHASRPATFDLDRVGTGCRVNFTDHMEFDVSRGSDHLLAVVEIQGSRCRLRLTERDRRSWGFFYWEATPL